MGNNISKKNQPSAEEVQRFLRSVNYLNNSNFQGLTEFKPEGKESSPQNQSISTPQPQNPPTPSPLTPSQSPPTPTQQSLTLPTPGKNSP